MSTNPFFLKGRVSPLTSGTTDPITSAFNGLDTLAGFPDSSDHGSTTDSEISSQAYLDLDIFNPESSTPESASPRGSLDGYDCNMPAEESYSEVSVNTPTTALKPSSSVLEMSIASLPGESQLKAALIKIRGQMAHCLETLREVEEKARNVPTLQVRISVLQEEKRQLLKQLQSQKKHRTRSAGLDEYSGYNRVGRGPEAKTEDDEFAALKKRLRAKLNSAGAGDHPVEDDDVFSVEPKASGARDLERNRRLVGSVHVQTNGIHDAELPVRPEPGPRVESRSIGVGTTKSATTDVGIGEKVALPRFSDKALQTSTSTRDAFCDPLQFESSSGFVGAVPQVKSTSTNTERLELPSDDNGDAAHSPSVSAGFQTTSTNPMMSIGVGICTVDDESCAECALRQANKSAVIQSAYSGNDVVPNDVVPIRNLAKEVGIDDTAPHGDSTYQSGVLDISSNASSCDETSRSIGVRNGCVSDLLCAKCDRVEKTNIGVGHGSTLDCDRCAARETRSAGTSTERASVTTVAVGDCCVSDNFCDRCMYIRTKTVGVGDCCVTDSFCDHDCVTEQATSGSEEEKEDDDDDGESVSAEEVTVSRNERDCDLNMNISSGEDVKSEHISNYLSVKLNLHESGVVQNDSPTSIKDNDSDGNQKRSRTGEKNGQADVISNEVVEACALLSKRLQKDGELGEQQMINCISTVEKHWFCVVSSCQCDPQTVKSFLAMLKDQIPMLLETIVNLADSNGNNALHYAVSFGNWTVVDVLLETGLAIVDRPNKVGYSSIMLAALSEVGNDADIPSIKRLLEAGNCDRQVEETGQTPLMLAAGRGRLDMVHHLLEAGAEINALDDDGSTALMCACEHGYMNVVKRLLARADCDATVEDNEGSTALSIAMEENHKDIALLIYGHLKLDPAGRPIF